MHSSPRTKERAQRGVEQVRSRVVDGSRLPPALVLSTAHEPYRRLDMADLANRGVEAIVDGRAAWHPEEARAAGLVYVGVGRP